MPNHRSRPLGGLLLLAATFFLTTCGPDSPTGPTGEPASPEPETQLDSVAEALAEVSAPEIFVGAGQVSRCDGSNDEATANLLDNIPGTVYVLGDNIRASGTAADYTNCYGPTWGRHKARTRPIPGDLEYQTTGATGYFGYFGTAAGDPAKGYYSYDLGDWHVIALNSNLAMAVGSAQEQWLKADLAANPKECTLAYWHHPRFSSRGTAVRSEVKPLWDALYAAGADVVLNAHYRVYERFAPQNPAGAADPVNGIRQFTVGTGGHGTEPFGSIRPNSEARSSGVFGVLKLTLSSGSYSWEFVPRAGQTFTDTGSLSCHKSRRAASISVAPTSASVQVGATVQLTATPRDDQGNPVARPVTWSSNTPAVATVSASGVVTGVAEGSATITATSDGQSATSAITVTAAPPPPPPGSPVLVGAGDISSCDETGDEATALLLDGIAGTVFTLGDNAYENGTNSEYANCYDPSWGRHKARTKPVAGNHEYNTSGAAGYYNYFGAAAGDPDEGYYSYVAGEWLVIVLNDNIDAFVGSPQEQWLSTELASSNRQCTLAMWHHPRFTSVSGRTTANHVKPLWDALYAAGADLILNGHDHAYERYAPQRPDGTADPVFGIRQITAGTGGQSLYAFGTIAANSQVRNNNSRGVLKLTLSPGSYAWQFIPIAGRTFTDSGTGDCHGAPGSTNQIPVAHPGGPYTGNEGASVSFSGTGSSDPDNNVPLTYAWTFGDGSNGAGVSPSHAYSADGSYTVGLTVTDTREGRSTPVTTTATIANVAPTVNTGPDASVTLGDAFSLSAAFSDPGVADGPWSYSIDWGDGVVGTGSAADQSNPITASHTYAAQGQFTVRVTVTDKDLGSRSDDLTVTVNAVPPSNQAPIAAAGGPHSGTEGAGVSFNGGGSSDPDNNLPLTYAWNFGDGATATGATPTHAFVQDGEYKVLLTVRDSRGLASDADTTVVTIGNAAPSVNAGADASVTAGATFSLSATFSDPGTADAPWSYSVIWGDGASANGTTNTQGPISLSHSYGAAGPFTVTVRVTDKDGTTGEDELALTVNPASAAQVLAGASNISSCSNNHDQLTASILDGVPGTVIAIGDNAFPDGTAADYANCYHPTWGRHKARTYAALGNHEYDTGTANAAFDYFGDRVGPRGQGYYSFDLGDWHIVVLNSNSSFVSTSAGSAQELWLKADLAASTKRCTLAVMHQERFFSSNTAGWFTSSAVTALWNDLYAAGAEIVLSGQRHQYERFAPQTPAGVRDDARGIRQFLVGTGGESVGASSLVAPNSEALSASRGVLKLTLGTETYSWQFIPTPNYTFTDSGSGTCH